MVSWLQGRNIMVEGPITTRKQTAVKEVNKKKDKDKI